MARKNIIDNYKRSQTFQHYNVMDNPFVVMNTKIDITNIELYCKKHKHRYATTGWVLLKAANQVPEMRVRFEQGHFYQYDKMNIEFMFPFENHVAGYIACEMKDNYKEFIDEYEKQKTIFDKTQTSIFAKDKGEIWCTCEPWLELTSIIPPYDKLEHTQEFIWDKIKEENGRYTINLCIMFHHGYLDGEQVGEFLKILNDLIEHFNQVIK